MHVGYAWRLCMMIMHGDYAWRLYNTRRKRVKNSRRIEAIGLNPTNFFNKIKKYFYLI